MERGIREVCEEGIAAIFDYKIDTGLGEYIPVNSIVGYFHEILEILNELEDDAK